MQRPACQPANITAWTNGRWWRADLVYLLGGKLGLEVFIFLTRGTTKSTEDTRQKADSRDAQIRVRPCYNTFQLKVFHEQNSKVGILLWIRCNNTTHNLGRTPFWCLKPRGDKKSSKAASWQDPGLELEGGARGEGRPQDTNCLLSES